MTFVACDESSAVLNPREEPLDPTATPHPTKRAAILRLRAPAIAAVPSDQLNPAFLPQPLVQSVAVIGTIADEPVGGAVEEAVVNRFVHERDLMGRCACDPNRDGKARAVCNGHDLGALPPFRLPDTRAPFFAPAKVASMKHSVRSMRPRS